MTLRYERILVPVDGSEGAEAVLPHALSLARKFGSTIELVRSYAVPPSLVAASAATALPGTGPALNAEPYLEAGRTEAEVYLEELEERLRPEGVPIEHRQLEGSAGESIVTESHRSGSDMIAMATHARAGIGRLVLGSVADYVVHHATCPVLLVRTESGQ